MQPTPTVTREDVERVIRRDFPADQFESAMKVLEEYGESQWHREQDRVRLAVLKLANGKMDELRQSIEMAKCDYRDALSFAEYPAYSKKLFRIKNLPEQQREQIIDQDWKQYETWLHAK